MLLLGGGLAGGTAENVEILQTTQNGKLDLISAESLAEANGAVFIGILFRGIIRYLRAHAMKQNGAKGV